MEQATAKALTNQWNDFLLRSVDPYATAKYRILLSWLGPLTGKSVLVVGSGSGEFACLCAKAGAKVTAFDIDDASTSLTKETARRFGVDVETSVSTLEDYPVDRLFDVVAATDVIEHISDDGTAAEKLVALVRPQGTLIITVPAMPWLFGYHDEVLHHFRRYTRDRLKALFSSKCRIHRLRYYGLFLVPVALLISVLLRRPYPVARVGEAERKSGLLGALVRLAFSWESHVSPPAGTSLLLLATVEKRR